MLFTGVFPVYIYLACGFPVTLQKQLPKHKIIINLIWCDLACLYLYVYFSLLSNVHILYVVGKAINLISLFSG